MKEKGLSQDTLPHPRAPSPEGRKLIHYYAFGALVCYSFIEYFRF